MNTTSVNKTKVIALTGATGFIGSSILSNLLADGYQVRILVRSLQRLGTSSPDITTVSGELDDTNAIDQLLSSADTLIHCAGRIKGNCANQFYKDNVLGTRNLVHAAQSTSFLKHFILISSLAAREPNISCYAHSKFGSEQELSSSRLGWTIIRPPAVYGPGDIELRPLFDWMRKGILWMPGSSNNRFSLLHVDDLAQLVIHQILMDDPANRIIEPDDGKSGAYTWNDVKIIASDYFDRHIHSYPIPKFILSSIAHANVIFSKAIKYSPMITPGKVRELLHKDWAVDSKKFAPGWTAAINLKTGLGTLYNADQKYTHGK